MDEKIMIKEIQKRFYDLWKQGLSPEKAILTLKSELLQLSIKAIETINYENIKT